MVMDLYSILLFLVLFLFFLCIFSCCLYLKGKSNTSFYLSHTNQLMVIAVKEVTGRRRKGSSLQQP